MQDGRARDEARPRRSFALLLVTRVRARRRRSGARADAAARDRAHRALLYAGSAALGQDRAQAFEMHHGRRLGVPDLRAVDAHADEGQLRVLLAGRKPGPQAAAPEILEPRRFPNHAGQAADGDEPLVVRVGVGDVDVLVVLDLLRLGRRGARDEPQVAVEAALEIGHGPAAEAAVGGDGGEHRYARALDELPELPHLLLDRGLVRYCLLRHPVSSFARGRPEPRVCGVPMKSLRAPALAVNAVAHQHPRPGSCIETTVVETLTGVQ